MKNHEKEANNFAKKHNITLTRIGEPEYRKYFSDDKEYRFVFKMKLKRNKKSYTFTFGQSIADKDKTPTMYDILSCIEKYNPECFEDFCSEYGYDTDSRKAYKTYLAVCKEYNAVERLFGDILEDLRNIN